MLLTVKLYNTYKNVDSEISHDTTGHLIFDRNNIIFVFPKSNLSCEQSQRIVMDFLASNEIEKRLFRATKTKNRLTPYARTSDPRHDVLDHMSSFDRYNTRHYHVDLEEDVTPQIAEKFLSLINQSAVQDSTIDVVMGPECRDEIEVILKKYNTNEDKYQSEEADQAARDYRSSKEVDFKKATQKVEKEKLKKEAEEKEETAKFGSGLTGLMGAFAAKKPVKKPKEENSTGNAAAPKQAGHFRKKP